MSSHSVFLDSGICDTTDHQAGSDSVRARVAPLLVFFITVFASMAAAAAVVSEAPLMVVGLY